MIGKIKGTLVEIESTIGLIETSGGIFYEVHLPPRLLTATPPSKVELYTHLQIRDNAHILFGFETKHHRHYFYLLISVSGVGPKTAFTVVSHAQPDELAAAVRNNDVRFFTRVPGLGKKTAMKVILELSQKLNEEFKMEKMHVADKDVIVIDALVSLGFKRQEAHKVYKKIPEGLSVEDKIKEGLRLATQK